MEQEELQEFERNPYYQEAVQLRKWDDQAKIPELQVPNIDTYYSLVYQELN